MSAERLPIGVITGFLGSGKTTVLNHLIRQPEMGETAVIVNEFGEIAIDHDLIENSDESTILLGSGCLCCTVRGDLVDTLHDLSIRRMRGEVPPFKRVVIETTGLADPAPILHALMSLPVAARYKLDTVVTTVDCYNGESSLDEHREAIKQAALADRIVLTKTDIAPVERIESLKGRIRKINRGAPVVSAVNGVINPGILFDANVGDSNAQFDDAKRWLQADLYETAAVQSSSGNCHQHDGTGSGHIDAERHDDRIRSFCLTFETPFEWARLAAWLDHLVASRGDQLLRVKGLVHVTDIDEPLVVHAVQHLFHPPIRLKAWPNSELRTRIVFITRDLERQEVEAVLEEVTAAAYQ